MPSSLAVIEPPLLPDKQGRPSLYAAPPTVVHYHPPNRKRLKQISLAEAILGRPGTQEFKDFVDVTRAQVMAGTCPDTILKLLLYYLVGAPAARVEVEDVTPPQLEGASKEALAARAVAILDRIKSMGAEDVEGTVVASESVPDDEPTVATANCSRCGAQVWPDGEHSVGCSLR
jgi:hypothetical protein